jgi:polyisoprenoid-binding protein YceI
MYRKKTFVIGLLAMTLLLFGACQQESSPTDTPQPAAEPTAAEPDAADTVAVDPEEGARTFVIVPEESEASYVVDEEFLGGALDKLGITPGLVDVIGSTQDIEGQLQLHLDEPERLGTNIFQVNLTGLSTDEARRDQWIQDNGPQFGQYPLATFVATDVAGAPDVYVDGEEANFQLVGDLTIRDITQPATFDVTAVLAGDTIRGEAEAQLRMSDFGIDPPNFANTLTVEDEFAVRVELVAREQ